MKPIIIRKPKFMRSDGIMKLYIDVAEAISKEACRPDLTPEQQFELLKKVGECLNKAAKAGGTFSTRNDIKHFCEWLKMSLGLDEEDISHIRYLATNGKYELECSAEDYLKNVPEETED